MRKRISIDQLKIGMKIEKLDQSWLATPFLRHRFTITSSEQITQLRSSGVQQLDVETDDDCQYPGSCVSAIPMKAEISQPISPTLSLNRRPFPLPKNCRQQNKPTELQNWSFNRPWKMFGWAVR